jgi:hypothetical protein
VTNEEREARLDEIRRELETSRREWATFVAKLAGLGDAELLVPRELVEALERITPTQSPGLLGTRA